MLRELHADVLGLHRLQLKPQEPELKLLLEQERQAGPQEQALVPEQLVREQERLVLEPAEPKELTRQAEPKASRIRTKDA
jgi:hypothetical protein